MPDITIAWDVANSRGDWVYQPFSIAGQQVNVSSPTVFGTGDGVTPAFTLTPTAGAIAAIISAQLYRNDWQGNQLLYATPRTNYMSSSTYTAARWADAAGAGITFAAGIDAPDGSNTAVRCDLTTATGANRVVRVSTLATLAAGAYNGNR
jgi:hypothetical protein